MSAPKILVDADACQVKEEVYRVAYRREVPVRVVSNAWLRVPDHPLIERVVVSDKFDAADDWIAEHSDERSVVVTGDIHVGGVGRMHEVLDDTTTPRIGTELVGTSVSSLSNIPDDLAEVVQTLISDIDYIEYINLEQRGYTVVIWRGRHVAEPTELEPEEVARYWLEVVRVAWALENPARRPG